MAAHATRSRPATVVARPRLLSVLARPWKVAVLSAPAGFGKTTLAAQYAAGRDTLWCRLGPEDRDPGHLLGDLLLAAARARRPFGARTRRLFESRRDMERDGAVLTASFLDELAPARGRRLVVLDDAHALAEAREGLQWLRRVIEESGPRVGFLVACRGECPLPLARLDLHGGSVVLHSPDLQFTDDEQARLLRDAFHLRAGSPARAALLGAVGGWPAGVVLAARHLQRDPDPRLPRRALADLSRAAGDERQLAGALGFLAEEVFAPLPPALQAALCRAALLEELDSEALELVIGRAGGQALLAEIDRRDLFVERLPDGTAARFHPLFREFLLGRLAGLAGEGERRRLSERLARHWMRCGEAARAIRVLADAGALEEAVRLFDEAAAGPAGPRGQALGPVALELARGAPARAQSALSPGVLLHGAYQARDARRHEETLRLAREAEAGFMRQRAFVAAARAFRLEGETALRAGRLRDSLRQGETLLRALPARQRAARGMVALQLGPIHLYMGEPGRARAVLREAGRWLRGGGHEIEEAECSLALATVAYTEGRWDAYLQFARRALPVFRRAGYRARAGSTLINMGEACTYLGLEDVALAHFDEASALLPRWGGRSEDPHLLIYRARAFAEKGELDEAARRFAAAREPVRRHGHPTQTLELDVWDGICARRRGRLDDAEVRLARAQAAFAGMEAPSWVVLARMERALVRGMQGHAGEALRELAAAARVTRRLGDEKELARNALFEARVRQVAGGAWRVPLRRALLALVRLDYLVLLRKEADVSTPLLAAALGAGPLRAVAARCLGALPDVLRERIEREGSVAVRAPRPARGRTGPAPAARSAGTADETAGAGLHVRLLGGFEVRVGGRRVTFPRRAAEALVACLALRRGAPVRRETLAEALWPETPESASRNRFDVALNAARHALEPGVPARGPFRALTTEGGLCRLGPGALATDVDDFERKARACEPFLAQAARAPWSAAAVPPRAEARRVLGRLETALDAYGGELLPGLPDAAWAETERERLRDRHHRLLLGLGQVSLALARPERADEAARQVLAADPLHEEALKVLLRALAARGERAAALRSYQDFVRRLADELDTAPSPETAALCRELTAGG
jgi:ATP/maltotriose-dependent transcriptional regulator MalT/DNA-binding SARP family transcriptional activator